MKNSGNNKLRHVLGALDAIILRGKRETRKGFLSDPVMPVVCGVIAASVFAILYYQPIRYLELGILSCVSIFIYIIIVFVRLFIAARQQVYDIPLDIRQEINTSSSFFLDDAATGTLQEKHDFYRLLLARTRQKVIIISEKDFLLCQIERVQSI